MKWTYQLLCLLSILHTIELLHIARDTTHRIERTTKPKLVPEFDRGLKTTSDKILIIYVDDKQQPLSTYKTDRESDESTISSSIKNQSSKKFHSALLRKLYSNEVARFAAMKRLKNTLLRFGGTRRLICGIVNGVKVPCETVESGSGGCVINDDLIYCGDYRNKTKFKKWPAADINKKMANIFGRMAPTEETPKKVFNPTWMDIIKKII